ncbi:uncharacterized protein LOC108740737 isoform X2 [Agrilus planipennis]|uniref:Uncharacterized protein LOC108740737 isoform X2 n=1 Tax=Agrilus planipennis TaxID=224129 RepID=A0A1W4XEB6_AGRPL|nr:uncharacterized protein LOC108740737 isoform X2 [Agrilus planipennis]
MGINDTTMIMACWITYVVVCYALENFVIAMMSGDSPNSQKHELFEFKEDRKPPSPTTSRDAAVQIENANANNTDLAAASAFSDKVNDEVSKEPYANEVHEPHKNEDEILATAEEVPLRTEKRQSSDGNYVSRNDNLNRLDGITIKPVNKKEETEEDESCGIKCLYYTLQCCECTIM